MHCVLEFFSRLHEVEQYVLSPLSIMELRMIPAPFSLQMVRRVRSAGRASSTRHGTRVSVTWRPSGCCRLPLSCETSPSRRPTSSCWRPTERACASFCSVPTVTSSHSDSLDLTRWATWLPRLVRRYYLDISFRVWQSPDLLNAKIFCQI